MSFKIDFDELKFFKEQLKNFPMLDRAIPDISSSIQLFHNTLESRVKSNFTTPGTLTDVMIGRTVAPVNVGKTFLRYSLQYQDKGIPLVKYPHELEKVDVEAKFPQRKADGGITWRDKNYAWRVNVTIRSGKPVVARRNKEGRYKGFLQKDKIFARKLPNTWVENEWPTRKSDGKRAYPLVELYGPSLAKVASLTYSNDTELQKAKDRLGSDILDAIGEWYP